MFQRLLIATAVLLTTAACATSESNDTLSAATDRSCSGQVPAVEALRLSPAQPSAARQSLVFASGIAPESIRFIRTDLATGPCAASLHAFVMDHVFLTDGRAFAVEAAGGGMSPLSGTSMGESSLSPRDAHPQDDGEFVMGYRVGYRRDNGALVTNYVGLWRDKGRSVVRAFSSLPGGRFTDPVPVLTSNLPLRSVTYFPAPDTPSGRLGLVQEDPRGETRLISLDWSHPTIFG
ncbi:MAG: hypothetical protein ACXW27_01270 [Allosphingosinicella sp.]